MADCKAGGRRPARSAPDFYPPGTPTTPPLADREFAVTPGVPAALQSFAATRAHCSAVEPCASRSRAMRSWLPAAAVERPPGAVLIGSSGLDTRKRTSPRPATFPETVHRQMALDSRPGAGAAQGGARRRAHLFARADYLVTRKALTRSASWCAARAERLLSALMPTPSATASAARWSRRRHPRCPPDCSRWGTTRESFSIYSRALRGHGAKTVNHPRLRAAALAAARGFLDSLPPILLLNCENELSSDRRPYL